MKRIIAALSATLLIGGLSSTAPATELIVNGGFESGDLTGWLSVNASVESAQFGVMPNSGSFMAVMGVGTSPPFPSDDALLLQAISFDTAAVNAVEVSFAYNMLALDLSPTVDFGTDALVVALIPIGAPAAALPLLTVPLNDEFDDLLAPEVLGWTTISERFSGIPDIGVVNLAFTFFLQNTMASILNGDEGQLLAAYIDDVSFNTVPEPMTLLLFSIGLAVLGLCKRLSPRAGWPRFSGARRPTTATARS